MNTIAPLDKRSELKAKRERAERLFLDAVYSQTGEFSAEDIRDTLFESGIDVDVVTVNARLRELKEMTMSPLRYENYRYSVRR